MVEGPEAVGGEGREGGDAWNGLVGDLRKVVWWRRNRCTGEFDGAVADGVQGAFCLCVLDAIGLDDFAGDSLNGNCGHRC